MVPTDGDAVCPVPCIQKANRAYSPSSGAVQWSVYAPSSAETMPPRSLRLEKSSIPVPLPSA